MLPKPQPKPPTPDPQVEFEQLEWLRNQTTIRHIADLANQADNKLDLLLQTYTQLDEAQLKCGLNTIATIRQTITCLTRTLHTNPLTQKSKTPGLPMPDSLT
jgi:hypothetical protein